MRNVYSKWREVTSMAQRAGFRLDITLAQLASDKGDSILMRAFYLGAGRSLDTYANNLRSIRNLLERYKANPGALALLDELASSLRNGAEKFLQLADSVR